jgi:hypothetical protein
MKTDQRHQFRIQDHPNFRVVQVSNRTGAVGMLLPHANLVVPDRRDVKRLHDIIELYDKLPAKQFDYGFTSTYHRSTTKNYPVQEVEVASINDLPLFEKC